MEEIMSSEYSILNIDEFINKSQMYTKNIFPDVNLNNLFTNVQTGNISYNFNFFNIKEYFFDEISLSIKLMISILILCIIHCIFAIVIENLDNKTNIKKVIDLITYLLISTLIINSFLLLIDQIKSTIADLVLYMKLLLPLLITLMIATGNLVTTSFIEPILLIMINAVGIFVESYLIPLILVALVIYIVSNLSDDVKLNKFGDLLKSSITWILGTILTIFVSIVSLEGNISSSVDGIASKTAKSAISTIIPVFGKVMGDATDTIFGCCNILKNSVGFIGVFVIISISILPIIKIFVMFISFRFLSAITEPMVDKKIVGLLGKFADCYKILLGSLCAVSILFIIGITLVIKITNSQMMYR